MSTDRDVERIVRSWMDEGVTALPDRVLDLVLDQLPATPQRRASWLARRFPLLNNNIVRFGIAAAAVVLVAIVGITLLPRVGVGGPDASPSPRASAVDLLVGMWAAPTTTCEQQNAAVTAAGFTADQIALSGWNCPNGGSNRYSVRFWTPIAHSLMTILDGTAQASETDYRIVDDRTFEAFIPDDPFCIAFRYVIDGDQLTIEVEHGCASTGDAPLNDQVALTAILETSPLMRQP